MLRLRAGGRQLPLPQRKRLVFFIGMIAMTAAIVEMASFAGVRCVDKSCALYPLLTTTATDSRSVAAFVNSPRFDPDLGWDMVPVCRPDTHIVPGEPLLAAVYGNSFSYGDEVDDNQTWEYQFNQFSAGRMANLGNNGAGTDQAYLKFLKYHHRYPARIVILSFSPENINRLVSRFGRIYFNWEAPVSMIKPRFIISDDGNVSLLRPPADLNEYLQMSEPDRMREAVRHDYWYNFIQQRFMLNPFTGRRPPYTIALVRMLYRRNRQESMYDHHRELLRNQSGEAYRILQHILNEFAERARQWQFTPLFMAHTLIEHDALYEYSAMDNLLQTVQARGIRVFNVHAVFSEEIGRGMATPQQLFAPDHHYSAFGNALLATRLRSYLQQQGLTSVD